MLEDSAYVRAIPIDCTQAFDTTEHTALMSKPAELQLLGNIYNWIGSFLSARQQVCRFNGTVSKLESCNLGSLWSYIIFCFVSRFEYIV